MIESLEYPFDRENIIKNKRQIKKELLKKENFIEKKIAILGGSTTDNVKQILELFLLNNGIKPNFYESSYNSFYEDAILENKNLDEFKPDIVYIYTTNRNICMYPKIAMNSEEIDNLLRNEFNKYKSVWDSLTKKYNCQIIQNNFEYPFYRIMGNRDAYDIHGKVNYVNRLNQLFYDYVNDHENIYINDINYVCSLYGLDRWYNQRLWYMYKYATDIPAIVDITYSAANIIKAIYGKNKKSIVLDLDNTLWGGIIGDDGVNNIILGKDEAIGEAYGDFQKYIKEHKDYGIILNINSKNDYDNAISGLNHPDSNLSPLDFVVIKANWEPKDVNMENIIKELNLGSDAFVFVDDNPRERDIVKRSFKNICTPNISEVEDYIKIMDRSRNFEILQVTSDDLNKTKMYKSNVQRNEILNSSNNYDDYLKCLEMKAVINDFEDIYLERITQLIGKSNQFNLTTKRYTYAEVEKISKSNDYIKLYGKLFDKFGDNGLVTVVIGKINNKILDIDLWLMSCRVLKRGLENAMMNYLVDRAKRLDIKTIRGYYIQSPKNNMVKDFYRDFGFKLVSDSGNTTIWELDVVSYQNSINYIEVNDYTNYQIN